MHDTSGADESGIMFASTCLDVTVQLCCVAPALRQVGAAENCAPTAHEQLHKLSRSRVGRWCAHVL